MYKQKEEQYGKPFEDFMDFKQFSLPKFKEEIDNFDKKTEALRKENKKDSISDPSELFFYNFIVAESYHAIRTSKRFLCQLMPMLARAGYKQFYTEFLYYEQKSLIAQFGKVFNKMSIEEKQKFSKEFGLKNYWDTMTVSPPFSGPGAQDPWYFDIIQAAWKEGIEVIGLEIKGSYLAQFENQDCYGKARGNFRYSSLNYTACHAIHRESQESSGKWFALVGINHLADFTAYTGALGVLCQDDKEIKSTKILLNQSIERMMDLSETYLVFADLSITADPHPNQGFQFADLKSDSIKQVEAQQLPPNTRLSNIMSKYYREKEERKKLSDLINQANEHIQKYNGCVRFKKTKEKFAQIVKIENNLSNLQKAIEKKEWKSSIKLLNVLEEQISGFEILANTNRASCGSGFFSESQYRITTDEKRFVNLAKETMATLSKKIQREQTHLTNTHFTVFPDSPLTSDSSSEESSSESSCLLKRCRAGENRSLNLG